jgi:predicted alpha/beta-fold hydrolase
MEPPNLLRELDLPTFRPRFPWIGGDLQTLRDTLRRDQLGPDGGTPIEFPIGPSEHLLAMQDHPPAGQPLGLVVLLHGLGGSSAREGLRRMGQTLQGAGFAVLRLNMRGAGPGRHLARGTYAANSNRDLLPVLQRARELARGLPLLGMGISLGGTKLLNALLLDPGLLDGLVTISSPLDLESCSRQIELPRNRLYQHWLLKRLVEQTLADPFGVRPEERSSLLEPGPRTIREFDAVITAPRWGYASVDDYYRQASPLAALLQGPVDLPPCLIVHAEDDPWVPVGPARQLREVRIPGLQVLLTAQGGHNGFHGPGGCWGDQLTARWLRRQVASASQSKAQSECPAVGAPAGSAQSAPG